MPGLVRAELATGLGLTEGDEESRLQQSSPYAGGRCGAVPWHESRRPKKCPPNTVWKSSDCMQHAQ